ncbi:MAG: HU family DNA-binding protein [Candidatus Adiutrix sp.]
MKHKIFSQNEEAQTPPPLTRREITMALSSSLALSAREAGLILDSFLEAIAANLQSGGVTTLSGLGRFETKKSPSRPGRNPKNGEIAQVPPRLRPVFTLSRSLRQQIKNAQQGAIDDLAN